MPPVPARRGAAQGAGRRGRSAEAGSTAAASREQGGLRRAEAKAEAPRRMRECSVGGCRSAGCGTTGSTSTLGLSVMGRGGVLAWSKPWTEFAGLGCLVAPSLLWGSSTFRFFESIRVPRGRNRTRHRKPNNLILGTETENRKPNRPTIQFIRFGSGSVLVFRF